MTNVLVTGASGFIGLTLTRRLLELGCRVRAVCRHTGVASRKVPGAEWITADVRDTDAMAHATAGVDTVFHLSSHAERMTQGHAGGEDHKAVTFEGTRIVLDVARAVGTVERMVFFSSVKAMGETSIGPSDEDAEARPESPYGKWKLAAERLMLDHGLHEGTHVCCLRLPMVWGPGHQGSLRRLMAAIDRGLVPPLPETNNRRSLVHVDDVVNAATLVATEARAKGAVYIVTDGQAYSGRQVYEALCRALGRRVPRWQVPAPLMRALAIAGDVLRAAGAPAPFDSDAYGKLLGSAWYSSAKITRELGFHAAVPLEAGLVGFVAWYRTLPR